jgi:hypothetical protein
MHNKSWSSSIVHRHSLNLTIPSKGEIFKVVSAKEDQPITVNEVKRFRADRMSRRADVQEGMSPLKAKRDRFRSPLLIGPLSSINVQKQL